MMTLCAAMSDRVTKAGTLIPPRNESTRPELLLRCVAFVSLVLWPCVRRAIRVGAARARAFAWSSASAGRTMTSQPGSRTFLINNWDLIWLPLLKIRLYPDVTVHTANHVTSFRFHGPWSMVHSFILSSTARAQLLEFSKVEGVFQQLLLAV